MLGDTDLDGTISVMDSTQIQKYLVSQIMLSEQSLKNSDTDGDTLVTVMDATQIQRFVAQIIENF